MSRAFVKDDDGENGERLPDRPISSLLNYVTRSGLAVLESRARELAELRRVFAKDRHDPEKARKLKEIERDLRYFERRLESAKLVDHSAENPPEVRFGAQIALQNSRGAEIFFRIVGEDEADPGAGRLCWASPLADELFGKKSGDAVVWKKQGGAELLTVSSVRYEP